MTSKKKSLLSVSAFTAPLLVTFILILTKISGKVIENTDSSQNMYLVVTVLQLAVFLIPSAFYYLIKGRKLSAEMFIAPLKLKDVIFLVFATLMFVCGNMLLKYLMYNNFGSYTVGGSDFSNIETGIQSSRIGIIVAFCIVPAICEELFFRGVILSEYRQYGAFNAVIMSSVCFALLHFSAADFIPCLFSGMVLGFLTVVCRTVFPAMLLHGFNNIVSLYGSGVFLRVLETQSGTFFVSFVFVALFGLSVLFLLSRLEHVYYQYAEKPPIDTLPPRSRHNFVRVFCAPTFYGLIIVFLIIMLFGV